ncbi:MAG: class I SAM-dependent methyltransferase, partial [Methanobacterium sp.]
MKCRICGNGENNKLFQVKEMSFGLGDEFTYMECHNCGCLQITEIPENMENYYPSNYYSFIKKNIEVILKMITYTYNRTISRTGIDHDSKILDVGTGSGNLLYALNKIGFKHLTGIDPYIKEDIHDNSISIFKKTIHELKEDEKFDLIIFDHSFEHIPDQQETLQKALNILSDEGKCLIRIPVKTDYIWNRYGVYWMQIDAPRHFFIHTVDSFKILTDDVGFDIKNIIFDSTEVVFWG